MGRFDQYITGTSPPAEEPVDQIDPNTPRIRVTPAPKGDNRFDQYVSGPVAEQKPATLNKPFGELKPSDPSWTEWAKSKGQDVLMALGAEPYRARHMSEGLVGIGSSLSPMGGVLSAADLSYDLPRGNYGHAALDALGTIPLANTVRGAIRGAPMIRTAETPVLETADYARGGGRAAEARRAWEASRPPATMAPQELPQGLRDSSREAYRFSERSPLEYHPDSMNDYTSRARAYVQSPYHGNGTFSPEKAPEVYTTLQRFEEAFPRGGNRPVTATDFDTLRQQLRGLSGPNGPAGRQAVDVLDTYMLRPPQGMLTRGTSADIADMHRSLTNARGDYRAFKTAQGVEDALEYAGVKAARANSGANTGNATRQELSKFVSSPAGERRLFGATEEERNAIVNAVVGDRGTNALRSASNLLGGGGGLGRLAAGHGGAGVGTAAGVMMGLDPMTTAALALTGGAVAPVTGAALRGAANSRTVRAAEEVAADIRRASPLYRAREAASPDVADPRAMYRDAITMAMIPKIKDEGKDIWDRAYVPYANR